MGTIQAAGPEDEDGPGPWEISGLWLFRGTDMLVNPDSEYYTWTKVDVSTDAGKAKVKECFIGDTVNGKKVRDPASSRKRANAAWTEQKSLLR